LLWLKNGSGTPNIVVGHTLGSFEQLRKSTVDILRVQRHSGVLQKSRLAPEEGLRFRHCSTREFRPFPDRTDHRQTRIGVCIDQTRRISTTVDFFLPFRRPRK